MSFKICNFELKLTTSLSIHLGTYQQAKNNIGKALEETDPEFESETEKSVRELRHKKNMSNRNPSDSEEDAESVSHKKKKKMSHVAKVKQMPPPPKYLGEFYLWKQNKIYFIAFLIHVR